MLINSLKSMWCVHFGIVVFLGLTISFSGNASDFIDSPKSQNTPEAELAIRQQIESSITLLENRNHLVPLDRLDTLRIAAHSVGEPGITAFQSMLANYMKVDFFNLPEQFTDKDLTGLKAKLGSCNLVITGFHSVPDSEPLMDFLSREKTSIITWFCDPRLLGEMKISGKPAGLIVDFQNDSLTQSLSANSFLVESELKESCLRILANRIKKRTESRSKSRSGLNIPFLKKSGLIPLV